MWLPTGFGKSVCLQALPFVSDYKLGLVSAQKTSIVLVVAPLVALMVDQVHSLREKGVGAVIISSGGREGRVAKALLATEDTMDCASLVFCSPDTPTPTSESTTSIPSSDTVAQTCETSPDMALSGEGGTTGLVTGATTHNVSCCKGTFGEVPKVNFLLACLEQGLCRVVSGETPTSPLVSFVLFRLPFPLHSLQSLWELHALF